MSWANLITACTTVLTFTIIGSDTYMIYDPKFTVHNNAQQRTTTPYVRQLNLLYI